MSCVDGPGTRYIVFLQGCTKRCVFCANPDSISATGGTRTSSKDVAARLKRAAPFLRKGEGGVTMSGGEPSIQPAFVSSVFQEAHALGLTTCIDTSGVLATEEVPVENEVGWTRDGWCRDALVLAHSADGTSSFLTPIM
eukprot:2194507-Rhodomonas_salina.1